MKNYYDELEVSKTASKEVIEKVYKVLAKKYHPDTTKEADKQAAEEKFKIISEAYEVLSDDEKRKKYDSDLEQVNPTISYEEYINVVHERDIINNEFNNLKNEFYHFKDSYNTNPYNNNTQNQYYQNQFNQTQYSQNQFNQSNQNFNNGFNNYQRPNTNTNVNQNNVNPNNMRPGKKYYYNTATGQPVSALAYYKYRIKKFISNIIFYIILIILFIMIIKSMITNGLQGLI